MVTEHFESEDQTFLRDVLTRELFADVPDNAGKGPLVEVFANGRRAVGAAIEPNTSERQGRVFGIPNPCPRARERTLRETPLKGHSNAMQTVFSLIDRVAPTEASVLVTGESGTGKELVAQTIHTLSRRRAGPFLAMNCGALTPTLIESELFGHEKGSFTGADRRRLGYFERAHGGTLFLDEITEMPAELQVKLLRVLEAGTVTRVGGSDATRIDVRILAASNRDPLESVANKVLREDLFYRLNVFPIHLPPLRNRGADITLLAQHFLDQLNAREASAKRFAPCALERLQMSSWPGNVRELKNVVERAAILADGWIDILDLPKLKVAEVIGDGDESMLRVKIGSPLAEVERRLILATLAALNSNKGKTAEALGISLKTLYNRLNMYQGHGQNGQPPASCG